VASFEVTGRISVVLALVQPFHRASSFLLARRHAVRWVDYPL
jgi:hypothetical protein